MLRNPKYSGSKKFLFKLEYFGFFRFQSMYPEMNFIFNNKKENSNFKIFELRFSQESYKILIPVKTLLDLK